MNDNEYHSYKSLLECGEKLQYEFFAKGDIDAVDASYKDKLLWSVVDFLKTIGCEEASDYVKLMTQPDWDE